MEHIFSETVQIGIADLDDSSPQFYKPESWKFQIEEFDKDAGEDFEPYEITQRILVNDDDQGPNIFRFELKNLDDIPLDLIEIIYENESSEAVLKVMKEVDRENQLIMNVNGNLRYEVTVFDKANNSNSRNVT